MFKRRREVQPTAPTALVAPDVSLKTRFSSTSQGGVFQFFFREELTPEVTQEFSSLLEKQLQFLGEFDIRPHRNEVVVTWYMKADDEHDVAEVERDTRVVILGALSDLFGWGKPNVRILAFEKE